MRGRESTGKLRVLVLEDEFFIADDIVQAAGAAGLEVMGPLSDVDAALSLIRSEPEIDVAILDVNLRGRMAFDLADLLAERGVPFVFATGYDESVIPERFAATPRWAKPFDYGELAQAVTAIAEART